MLPIPLSKCVALVCNRIRCPKIPAAPLSSAGVFYGKKKIRVFSLPKFSVLSVENIKSPSSVPSILFIWQSYLSMEFSVSIFNAHRYMESAYMVTHLEIPSRMPPCVLFGKCPNPPQYSPQIICIHVF